MKKVLYLCSILLISCTNNTTIIPQNSIKPSMEPSPMSTASNNPVPSTSPSISFTPTPSPTNDPLTKGDFFISDLKGNFTFFTTHRNKLGDGIILDTETNYIKIIDGMIQEQSSSFLNLEDRRYPNLVYARNVCLDSKGNGFIAYEFQGGDLVGSSDDEFYNNRKIFNPTIRKIKNFVISGEISKIDTGDTPFGRVKNAYIDDSGNGYILGVVPNNRKNGENSLLAFTIRLQKIENYILLEKTLSLGDIQDSYPLTKIDSKGDGVILFQKQYYKYTANELESTAYYMPISNYVIGNEINLNMPGWKIRVLDSILDNEIGTQNDLTSFLYNQVEKYNDESLGYSDNNLSLNSSGQGLYTKTTKQEDNGSCTDSLSLKTINNYQVLGDQQEIITRPCITTGPYIRNSLSIDRMGNGFILWNNNSKLFGRYIKNYKLN